jgi:hypothetical protein
VDVLINFEKTVDKKSIKTSLANGGSNNKSGKVPYIKPIIERILA